MEHLTPMMKQYFDIKKNYPDFILFYRLGDFYEMFFDDAVKASKALDITLTSRASGNGEKSPLCGVPYHSADGYLAKLVEKGFKVAICEQTEDPALAKGIVKREVVRIVTPGTVIDPSMLEDKANNYLASLVLEGDSYGLAYADITTGELRATGGKGGEGWQTLTDELVKLKPSEIVLSLDLILPEPVQEALVKIVNPAMTTHPEAVFAIENAHRNLCRILNIGTVDSFGLEKEHPALRAAGALVSYIEETQMVQLTHFRTLQIYHTNAFMLLDKFTRRNLELTETLRGKDRRGSLLWVLDKTKTAMGGRKLRKLIEEPSTDLAAIIHRHEAVEALLNDSMTREELRETMNQVYDMERLCSKVVYGTVNARDLGAMKQSLAVIPAIKSLIHDLKAGELQDISDNLDDLQDVCRLIDEAIHEDPPFSVREGGFIRDGYNQDLDELRTIMTKGKFWILEVEAKERETSGIKNLKIGFNKVFGYYIEITKSNLASAPEHYIRKQTLANAERYITPELKEIETKILGAEERIFKLEYELFTGLREQVLSHVGRILQSASALALLDVLGSFAEVSFRNRYVRPEMLTGNGVEISDGRHPVVEQITGQEGFVPNDTLLDITDNQFYIITGPNMAGKSTYLRQVALIVLMGQMGCFVPATSVRMGIVDRVFTRIGASDDLFQGQSTFMVEMTELANILNNTTVNSLIILDEIGRGTSTYDGLSIAWAVVEYLSANARVKAKTLFATHYHELTELEGKCPGVKNYCISVKEIGEQIVFLRKIIRGGANQSFGIQVARLAGIPTDVIRRAKEILIELEEHDINNPYQLPIVKPPEDPENPQQLDLFMLLETEIVDELRQMNILEMTPMSSFNKLYELIQKVQTR